MAGAKSCDAHEFHFSPRPNRAHEIRWRPWGPDAFQEAAREGKPILLAISAVWCHWCHVMDETSYSDEQVISLINDRYVPVRVDNDQRPDVNARYNMGGWPSTAFLTPDGEVLAGLTYVPPDQMRQALEQVSAHFRDNREAIQAKVREIQAGRQRAAASAGGGELSATIVDAVLAAAGDAYDPVYGGFGSAPKFPHSDVLDLLLHVGLRRQDRDLVHMARKTLERMSGGGIFDRAWGGFFRYATNRDWSVPHFEKMLEDNSNLLRNLLRLYRVSGEETHADTARRVVEYMDRWLSDPETGAFYGSQDADEEFYALGAAERERVQAPYVDRTAYTSWNAMAASAYLEASWTLHRPDLADRARRALDFLWRECRAPEGGMYRFHDGTPHQPGLLGDQVFTARAFLDAFEVSAEPAYLERAEDMAALLVDRFADGDGGGFYDVWEGHETLGRLGIRQKPLAENAVAAEVFLRLGQLTRRPDYEEAARRTLEGFSGDEEVMGHFAAAYARAVDLLLDPPVEVRIVGDPAQPATAALHIAALALPVAARTVDVLHPSRDAARLEALILPAEPSPAAYVCHGTLCSAPVQEAGSLLAAVVETAKAAARMGDVSAQASADLDAVD
jgi:uncharacterized protein YyaL (SSP411 family)